MIWTRPKRMHWQYSRIFSTHSAIMSITKEQKRARFMMYVCVIIGFLAAILAIWSLFDKVYYIAVFSAFIIALQYYNYKQWQKKA